MSTAAATQPAQQSKLKLGGLALAIAIGLALHWLPLTHGLIAPARLILQITAFTVVLWVFQVINPGFVSILMMGLMLLAGVRPPSVFSGFSSGGFWVLVCVLFYGFAMQHTGLAQRMSYYVLTLFPGTYTGVMAAFLVIGAVLALGIPSMTVRTAIMVPIAWALVKSVGLTPRSRGSALIMISCVEMAVFPGCAFLYGSLFGPVVDQIFHARQLPISWLGYAQVLTLPVMAICVALIFLNRLALKPEAPLNVASNFGRERLNALGKITRGEMITAAVVLGSIAFWATDRYHHYPSFLIGMFGLAVFALCGIVRDKDIGSGISWPLVLFMGGVFSLASVVQEYKVTDWLAALVLPSVTHLVGIPVLFLLVVGLVMYLARFLDPSGMLAIPMVFLPVVEVAARAGIVPLVTMAAILITAIPFWASYQNIWIAMGENITEGLAFTAAQRARLASVYGLTALAALILAAGYWKMMGML
ncbi:MAG: SLC13 family permease [Candidatus Angelobacter sp.]